MGCQCLTCDWRALKGEGEASEQCVLSALRTITCAVDFYGASDFYNIIWHHKPPWAFSASVPSGSALLSLAVKCLQANRKPVILCSLDGSPCVETWFQSIPLYTTVKAAQYHHPVNIHFPLIPPFKTDGSEASPLSLMSHFAVFFSMQSKQAWILTVPLNPVTLL